MKKKKNKNEIHLECIKIIEEFKYKYGSKEIFFSEILGISKSYFSKKRKKIIPFNYKDLEKLRYLKNN